MCLSFGLGAHPPDEDHLTPDALGSPRSGAAVHSRMSGAGISMFYGAETEATAVAEIRPAATQAVTIARWQPGRYRASST